VEVVETERTDGDGDGDGDGEGGGTTGRRSASDDNVRDSLSSRMAKGMYGPKSLLRDASGCRLEVEAVEALLK
jgi:hypothetical protein